MALIQESDAQRELWDNKRIRAHIIYSYYLRAKLKRREDIYDDIFKLAGINQIDNITDCDVIINMTTEYVKSSKRQILFAVPKFKNIKEWSVMANAKIEELQGAFKAGSLIPVCPSEWAADTLRQCKIEPRILEWGLETERTSYFLEISRKNVGIPEDVYLIIHYSSLDIYDNTETLIQAFSEEFVKNNTGVVNAVLLICVTASSDLRIEKFKNKLEPTVINRFIYFCNVAYGFCKDADLLVSCPLASSVDTSVLNALKFNVPVVVPEKSWAREYVECGAQSYQASYVSGTERYNSAGSMIYYTDVSSTQKILRKCYADREAIKQVRTNLETQSKSRRMELKKTYKDKWENRMIIDENNNYKHEVEDFIKRLTLMDYRYYEPLSIHSMIRELAAICREPNTNAIISSHSLTHFLTMSDPYRTINAEAICDCKIIDFPSKKRSIVLCKTSEVRAFFRSVSAFVQFKYTLVTFGTDEIVDTRYAELFEKPELIAWFSQSMILNHPKAYLLPTGILSSTCGIEKAKIMVKAIAVAKRKKATASPDLYTTDLHLTSYGDYLDRLSGFKYCICPDDNSQQFWECLYLDVIPIVLKCDWNVPVIVVKNWTDVTPELLRAYKENVKNPTCKQLNPKFWANIIKKASGLKV
jgi:hypothetical protein